MFAVADAARITDKLFLMCPYQTRGINMMGICPTPSPANLRQCFEALSDEMQTLQTARRADRVFSPQPSVYGAATTDLTQRARSATAACTSSPFAPLVTVLILDLLYSRRAIHFHSPCLHLLLLSRFRAHWQSLINCNSWRLSCLILTPSSFLSA